KGSTAFQNVAVVGLGIGTLAAYSGKQQRLTFFELNPTDARIARDPRFFTYLRDCEERGVILNIVLGDARLQLQRTADQYGIIVLDAFSSDTIPIHLLTREAVGIYLDHLRENGILAFHISSRYFRLAPVLAAVAENRGLICLWQEDNAS